MTDMMRQEAMPSVAGAVPARVWRAPTESGELRLGRTLVSLLDEAVERNPNEKAFSQQRDGKWHSLSTLEFRDRAQALALALAEQGFEPGDKAALFAASDISFTVPDMACLMSGLVSVPIYLTHSAANIAHILRESESRLLFVTDEDLLLQIRPHLIRSSVTTTVVMEGEVQEALPQGVRTMSSRNLLERGRQIMRENPQAGRELSARVGPGDVATIIYTSGTTGVPKGVMLSHENISSNAIASFTGLSGFGRGDGETVLSFLPLTHVFARMLQYGCMWYGSSVYYSDAERLREHFREVRPTLMATVPRVLEAAYERILDAGAELTGAKRRIFDWSLQLARRFDVERPPQGVEAMRLRVADRLVLSKWREALGGRMCNVIVGAAALRPELVNIFGAAGINVLQGYGLTETSPVICYNRPEKNRPGTVGTPIAGVEVAVGAGGEIITRGPHVMIGYYRRDEETVRTVRDGWLHTGDLGEIDDEGFVSLTGRLKSLFKLSTGKYVMPQPIEQKLEAEKLVEHAVVVGEGEKYCAALLFLSSGALTEFDRHQGRSTEPARLLREEHVQERLRAAIRRANGDLPGWSCVKRAVLLIEEISIGNGLLTPTLKLRREPVLEKQAPALEELYRPGTSDRSGLVVIEV